MDGPVLVIGVVMEAAVMFVTCLERSEGSTCITNIHPKNPVNSYFPFP